MAQLLGLSAEQVDHIRPLFPKERGVKRVDDRKVLSGIIHVLQKGLRWVDALAVYGPPQNPRQTVAAAGETRVFLSRSFLSCQYPTPQSYLMPQSQRC